MGFQPERTCEKCKAFNICSINRKKQDARFCDRFLPIPPPPPPRATSSVQRKDNTKVFLEIGIDTVPSEMTARIFLQLVENYCNHFNKYIVIRHNEDGTKTLEFRPKEN